MITLEEIYDSNNLERIYSEHIIYSSATGIDKVSHKSFRKNIKKQISIVERKVLNGDYSFTKYKLKLISKGRGKAPREISIPTIRDRIILRGLCDYLNEVYKNEIEFDIPQKIIKKIKEQLETKNYTAFIKLDIENFYPSIDHELLLKLIRKNINENRVIKVISSAITTQTIEKSPEEADDNLSGVPQGLSISNILAAIYLSEIDKKILDEDFAYFRYVDDILILCNEPDSKQIADKVIKLFNELKLNIYDPSSGKEKSKIGVIDKDSFTYLGYLFEKDKTTVRTQSIERTKGFANIDIYGLQVCQK